MKRTLRSFAWGAVLLTAFACGKNDPDPTPDPDPEVVAENLSKEGTSNCYIIEKEGDYSFDATVRGNGAATDGLAAPAKMDPDSALLSGRQRRGWSRTSGLRTERSYSKQPR